MRTQWTAAAAAAVVLTCTGGAAASTLSSAEAAPSHVARPTEDFTVVEHAKTDTVVDNAPKGDSIGDLLAFGNPIFDRANNHLVGRDQGSCVRTNVGTSYECSWTVLLQGGSLVVQGPFYDTHDSVLAVTGGTGRWSTAQGQMRLHARNAAGIAYNFQFTLRR